MIQFVFTVDVESKSMLVLIFVSSSFVEMFCNHSSLLLSKEILTLNLMLIVSPDAQIFDLLLL